MIEEHIKDRVGLACPDGCTTRIAQQFWGDRYIDDAVARRMKTYDAQNPNYQEFWPENTWWYVTDAQFSAVALLDLRANLVERLVYDSYGKATHIRQTDVNYDGVVDNEDFTIQESVPLNTKIYDNNYHPDVDFQRSGIYDSSNRNVFLWAYNANASDGGAVADGEITETDPYAFWPSSFRVNPLAPDNPIGYCGYVYNPETQDYTVRFRHYSPRLGRWLERDPAGYVDGMNLMEYVRSSPIDLFDSHGLEEDDYRTPDEKKKEICEALQDAIDHNMSLDEFLKKYATTWGEDAGVFYQSSGEYNGKKVDIDWLLTLLYANRIGKPGAEDITRDMPLWWLYHIGKPYWILQDSLNDDRRSVWDFFKRYRQEDELNSIDLGNDILNGRVNIYEALAKIFGCKLCSPGNGSRPGAPAKGTGRLKDREDEAVDRERERDNKREADRDSRKKNSDRGSRDGDRRPRKKRAPRTE